MVNGKNKRRLAGGAAAVAVATAILLAGAAGARAENAEIIVLATKRAESLQDVPIAVTPLTGETIRMSGARDVAEIAQLAAPVQFNLSENETSATARIRGLGTQGSNPGLESAVGVFVDGVHRARNGVAIGDLGPLEQVEVLRGPQGTLFGRNTSAGAIVVRTAAPDLTRFSVAGVAEVGNFDARRLSLDVNAPLENGRTALRVFGAVAERDGFIDVFDAQGRVRDSNDQDYWFARAQLALEPNDSFSARIIADASERDEHCCAATYYDPRRLNGASAVFPAASSAILAGFDAFGGGTDAENLARLGQGELDSRRGFANELYGQNITDRGVSAEVNADLGGATLTSISSWREWRFDRAQDGDFTSADIRLRPDNGENGFAVRTYTQEWRLAGETGPVSWLAGAYYGNETLVQRDGQVEGSAFGPYVVALAGPNFQPLSDLLAGRVVGVHDRYEQRGETAAVFGHGAWTLWYGTVLSAGLRHTWDEKNLKARLRTDVDASGALATAAANAGLAPFGSCDVTAQPADPAQRATLASLRTFYCLGSFRTELDGQVLRQSYDDEETSGTIALFQDFTRNVNGYLSYARGYKAGGFNLDRDFGGVTFQGLTPVTATFRSDFPAEFVDAYEAGVKTSWFGDDLLVNAAIFYEEAENYQLNTFNGLGFQVTTVPEVETQGVELDWIWRGDLRGFSAQGGLAYVEAEYGDDAAWVARTANPITGALTNARLPGSRLTNAPLWTVTQALDYRATLYGLSAFAHVDARYVSSQNTGSNLAPQKVQPEYTIVNARVGLGARDDRYVVELWGRNIFDETAAQITFDAPLQPGAFGAFLNDPATYGVTVRARY